MPTSGGSDTQYGGADSDVLYGDAESVYSQNNYGYSDSIVTTVNGGNDMQNGGGGNYYDVDDLYGDVRFC